MAELSSPGRKIVITGGAAICGAGRTTDEIWDSVVAGRSAIAPIRQWDASTWPVRQVAEFAEFRAAELLGDRKLVKLTRRTDIFGIHAASQAAVAAGLPDYRDGLDEAATVAFNDRTGVYVGTSGGSYASQYDFFPLLSVAGDDLVAFGEQLGSTVNPMWLLKTLPNNVLCHVGIRFGLKGPNACITNHAVAGLLAAGEAIAALRAGEADRAVVVGHDALIEPQQVIYYERLGLQAKDTIRPFDADRSGSVFGEGAGALVLETEAAAAERGASVLGECLGSGATAEAHGLLPVEADGDGLARAIEAALADAGLASDDVGMIVAHGNGTVNSDASEAAAIVRVFGDAPPPTMAVKAITGHLFAASGVVESLLALRALREGTVPGVATLRQLGPDCSGLAVSSNPQRPRSDVALVLSRGFAGTDAALLLRAGS